jgi:hypothetical protein
VESGAAAILVVDDCPDQAHRDLLNKARHDGSLLRIVTTDVETRTQQSKHNLVVELGPASNDLIDKISKQNRKPISSADVQFVRELEHFPI